MKHSYGMALLPALLLLIAPSKPGDLTGAGNAPSYAPANLVNAATQLPEALAPNTIATLYGSNLSWNTYAITTADVNGGMLPQTVQGVEVVVGGINASIFYVSPTQINFLVPYELSPGETTVYVLRQGVMGPSIPVLIRDTSSGFFEWNGNLAVAQHADGSLVAPASPAVAGETIVLYAVGLGHTAPATQSGRIAQGAAQVLDRPSLQVLINGTACPASTIQYAGLTPGFSGLYQINLQLPDPLPQNPVIQISVGSDVSPNTVLLPAR